MSGWNGMSFEGKQTMLGVVRREAGQFFEMVDSDDVWEAPTGAGHWQVRDVVAQHHRHDGGVLRRLRRGSGRPRAAGGVRVAGDG